MKNFNEEDLPAMVEPLIQENCVSADKDYKMTFDEQGILVAREPLRPPPELVGRIPESSIEIPPLFRPCSLNTLNGSWFFQLTPTFPHLLSHIRGPMRIEAGNNVLRISGDIYVKSIFIRPVGTPTVSTTVVQPTVIESIPPGTLIINRNWYPAFPHSEYRWYFRSLGCSYASGKLTFSFERHLWNTTTEEFSTTDTGTIELNCSMSIFQPVGWPWRTIQMSGTAIIGGQKYNVIATKTSPFYRGCLVEVDVMNQRSFPSSATSCDGSRTYTFTGIYRDAGLDFRVQVDELNVPEDLELTTVELNNLLASHRSLSAGGDNWSIWLFVGSRQDDLLGLMFDTSDPPYREGAVGFFDETLPNISIIESSARGKKVGEAPLAYLRTLVHEAGHTFNLFHPKNDCHNVPIGTTIMNQTGDAMSFA